MNNRINNNSCTHSTSITWPSLSWIPFLRGVWWEEIKVYIYFLGKITVWRIGLFSIHLDVWIDQLIFSKNRLTCFTSWFARSVDCHFDGFGVGGDLGRRWVHRDRQRKTFTYSFDRILIELVFDLITSLKKEKDNHLPRPDLPMKRKSLNLATWFFMTAVPLRNSALQFSSLPARTVTSVPSSMLPKQTTRKAAGSVLFDRQWVGNEEQRTHGLPVRTSSPPMPGKLMLLLLFAVLAANEELAGPVELDVDAGRLAPPASDVISLSIKILFCFSKWNEIDDSILNF